MPYRESPKPTPWDEGYYEGWQDARRHYIEETLSACLSRHRAENKMHEMRRTFLVLVIALMAVHGIIWILSW